MKNPNPNCEKDCRFTYHSSVSSAMAWYPEYDKNGKLLNANPNYHMTSVSCKVCGQRWRIIEKYGQTTIVQE